MRILFNSYANRYDSWYRRNKLAYLSELRALKKVLPKNGKGLEIGVGTGRFAAPLGIEYGIDPSPNMLKIAQSRGVNVHLGFGEDIPFPNKSFEYVAIIITLCFVKNPTKVIEEAKRIIKKNGRIIIGIVDKETFLGKFYQRKKSAFYKQAKLFSVKEVVDLLKQAGFVSFAYYQTISVLPERMSLIETPRKGFGRAGFVVISALKHK